ncbi:MOSC domain-containing protein [Corynebacterium pacaense]|uniref:MOSC domain-containing protein n=1 Tax=Corynebacterium pacaense TaxID=1816684 RepID=UPI0009B97606|nr:MOSC domain-containing protein [Corynebacterium pacaense]
MNATVLSTNLAQPQPDPGGDDRVSGILKLPVPSIEVFTPGPDYGDGSGVRGDVIGDSQHHGGAQKAVYAFTREELDHWGYPDGYFGENLTTLGIELHELLINQQIRVGGAVLEVSVPRRPCRTFGAWLDRRGWMKTFTERARPGSYFRVVSPGVITAGDDLDLIGSPGHDITMEMAFRAKMGDRDLARRVVAAGCLPGPYHDELARLI